MFDLVAQLVEHNTFNVGAQGSNPCGITKALNKTQSLFYVIYLISFSKEAFLLLVFLAYVCTTSSYYVFLL